jgi:hypothetical protein
MLDTCPGYTYTILLGLCTWRALTTRGGHMLCRLSVPCRALPKAVLAQRYMRFQALGFRYQAKQMFTNRGYDFGSTVSSWQMLASLQHFWGRTAPCTHNNTTLHRYQDQHAGADMNSTCGHQLWLQTEAPPNESQFSCPAIPAPSSAPKP